MNFLGHLYLAGTDPNIRLGNFIADHIKGIPLSHFSPRIREGIMMHRAIDYFTDSHPAMAECRRLLRPGYAKYAGVALDVVLDFYLADNWHLFSNTPLRPFLAKFYLQLLVRWRWLPPFWKRMLPGFIQDNRIYRYRKIDGICESLDIMSRTTSLPDASLFARGVMEEHYNFFLNKLLIFIPAIAAEMDRQFGILPIKLPPADPESS